MTINTKDQELASNGTEDSIYDISVIIPTYRRYEHLADTCNYLSRQIDCRFETLIVDQTPIEKRNMPEIDGIRYFEQDIPSASAARNLALKNARADIVLFLDDDVIIEDSSFLQKHLRHYADPRVLGVAGAAPDLGQSITFLPHRFYREGGLGWIYFPSNIGWQSWIKVGRSNNLSVRKKEAIACGGMDEQFEKGAHREEADFGLRLNGSKTRILFDPHAQLIHVGSREGGIRSWSAEDEPKALHHMVGDLYFMLRHISLSQRSEYLLLSFRYFITPRGIRTSWKFSIRAFARFCKAWSIANSKVSGGPKLIQSA
jgi:glycosyltransferase involved in cell wall biosynthesis